MSRQLEDWLDGYMEFTSETEPPFNYRLWSAISVVAGALQRKCRLDWGSLTFYPNMYIILVGPPGRARKGTAMNPAKAFLEDLNVPMSAEAITREALIRTVADANDSVIDIETGVSQFHSSLTVFSPELTVFLGHNNYQLMSDLTDWFDCARKWTYRTKGQGTDEIIGVWINLIGATTPDLIRTALPLDAIGGGLTSRMIFIFEQNKGKIVPTPFLSDKERKLRDQLMFDLERIHNLQGTFRVTEEMVQYWIEWYTQQESNPPFNDKRFAGYIERRPLHVMKLAMICSASRSDKMVITDSDLQRAVSILTKAEVKMPQAFSGVGKSRDADTLEAIMNEIAIRKQVTNRELLGMFYHDIDQRTYEGIIQTLQSLDFVDVVIKGTFSDNIVRYKGNSATAVNQALKAASENGG